MISNKDQKILWARAAGRCSMPECRNKLTLDEEDSDKTLTLGEMCHIVGEKNSNKSPRGLSKMPLEDRDKYSNLILLCRHHHGIIDKNEKAWPIEVLHKIKDEHELWVEETLNAEKLSPDELLFTEMVDLITEAIQLKQWNWFIDNAVRHLVHPDFITAGDIFSERLLAIDWPNSNVEFEKALRDVMKSYIDYIEQYLEGAKPRDIGDFYGPDNSYKVVFPNTNYAFEAAKSDLWAQKNFLLLCKFTSELNVFVKSVRENLNPYFFKVKGKFLIVDSLGTHLGNWGAIMDPKSIKNIDKRINELDLQLEKLIKEQNDG